MTHASRRYVLEPPRRFNLSDEDYVKLLIQRVRSAREGRETFRNVARRLRSGFNNVSRAMLYWKSRALAAEFELAQLKAGREVIYLPHRPMGILGEDDVLEISFDE